MNKISEGVVGIYILALKRNERLADVPSKWLKFAQAVKATGGQSFEMPEYIKMIMRYKNEC